MKTKVRILGFVALLVISLFVTEPASAATIVADSCSDTDVQDAIDTAMDGDTVEIPAGSCTWTSQVITPTTKRLDIVGAGIDVTVITPNVTPRGLHIQPKANEVTSLSHMTFTGGAVSNHVVGIWSANGRFHVHHVEFDLIGAPTAIQVGHRSLADPTYGLIDHSTFTDTDRKKAVDVVGQDATWTTAPQDFGTIDAVYFEDNHVEMDEGATGTGFVNSSDGARVVVRYNTLVNVFYGTHGDCTGGDESTLLNEIYENDFTLNNGELTQFILIRGGTGIAYNNTMTGTPNSNPMIMSNYDSCMESCQNGLCGGYPCDQQVGRTANQVLSPWYEWDNLHGGSNMDMAVNGLCMAEEDHVQAGRDFINDTEMMGYTPFTYPHPYIDDVGLSIDVSDSVGVVDDDVFDLDTELLMAQAGPSPTARTVTPEAFGAVGNGVTDDTEAIQDAIDYASPVATTVYLPRGTYAISAALQMRSNVCLLGESPWATVIYQTDTNLDVIEMSNTVASGNGVNSNMCIMSMTITHEQSTYLDVPGDGISAGDSTAAWEQTEDVLLKDLIIRDIPQRSVKAWKNPQRWSLDNVTTIRAGGGGPYFIHGDDIDIIGGRCEETGDDCFNFANSTQNVTVVGHVFNGCGTLSGAPGGRCISTNGRSLTFSGLSMSNYEDAAIQIVEDNSGNYCPEDILISGLTVKGAASTDSQSRIIRITDACGNIRIDGMIADGYNYVADEVDLGIDINGSAGRIMLSNLDIYGVHRCVQTRAATYISIRASECDASTAAIDFVDGNTIDELRLVDNVFRGTGNVINFPTFSTGVTVTELFTRGNRSRMSSHFIRIPSGGHAITMADMRGDVQNLDASLINDIGGSSVTTLVELGVIETEPAASLGAVTAVKQIFDADGDPIGYVPVYDGFTAP